ncbi:hypothetical protein [Gordonia sp. CPCC 205333]|uniref:hypothetical protein n=1 Tax=Gordonia sp. CPCC 205333 TaxID=3140790 RepID=UPI003AF372CB
MGIFTRKTAADRQSDAMTMLDNIGAGRGFTGKMTKAFMGSEFTESVQQASTSLHQAEHVATLRAAGTPARSAIVANVTDTGRTINDNPDVLLTIELDGQFLAVTTLVSRIAIPRVGDTVLVVIDPATNAPLYAGLG